MRSPVPLPADAQDRLSELTLARDSSLDQARSAASRLQALPQDADGRMRSRLIDEQRKHDGRHNSLARLVSAISQWRMELPHGATLEAAPPISVDDLKPGETLTGAIDTVRSEIASAKQQLDATKRAPLPKADQRALIAAHVARMALAAKPAVSVQNDTVRIGWREELGITAALAWVLPVDQLVDALMDALPVASGEALSADERTRRIVELEKSLLKLERQEESLIMQAADAGHEVLRRVDASPLAVLNVAPANFSRAVERSAA